MLSRRVASRISGWLSSIACNSASWDSDVDSDSSSGVTFAVDFAATRPTSLLAPVTGTPETQEFWAAGARTATAGLKATGARERGTAGTPELPSDFLPVVVSGGGRSFVQGSGLAFFALLALGFGLDCLFGGCDRIRGIISSGTWPFGWDATALALPFGPFGGDRRRIFSLAFGLVWTVGSVKALLRQVLEALERR